MPDLHESRGQHALRRRHKLRTDRILYVLRDNRIDSPERIRVKMPAEDILYAIELRRTTRTPQRDSRSAIQHPPHGKRKDRFAESLSGIGVERTNGSDVLRPTRRQELGVTLTQVVALEFRPDIDAAGQQPTA